MIIGNKSAGIKDTNGNVVRRVSVWDRLEVNGTLQVSTGGIFNSVTAGVTPSWAPAGSPGATWPYECVGVNAANHNLRLLSNNGVYVHAPQGLFVDGGAAAKHFRIPHPLDPDHRHLVHSCIEGPEIGVYYRGEGQLTDGIATVELPGYFEALTRKEGRTVQLTAIWEGPGKPCAQLAARPVQDGRFTVHCVDRNNPSQRFYWEVKAVRADAPPLVTEPPRQA